MGSRGPIPNPHGRRAKARERKEERDLKLVPAPIPEVGVAEKKMKLVAPRFLSKEARKHWTYIVTALKENNTFQPTFLGTIAAAATAYGDVQRLAEDVEELRAAIDEYKQDPEFKTSQLIVLQKSLLGLINELKQARRDVVTFEAKLLLNPNDWARSGMAKKKREKQSRLERLIG